MDGPTDRLIPVYPLKKIVWQGYQYSGGENVTIYTYLLRTIVLLEGPVYPTSAPKKIDSIQNDNFKTVLNLKLLMTKNSNVIQTNET